MTAGDRGDGRGWATAGAGDKEQGRGQGCGTGIGAGGDDVVKASLDRKAIRLAGGETQQLVPKLVADRKTGCWG